MLFRSLLFAVDDVGDVAVRFDDSQSLFASVGSIGAEVLVASNRRTLALDDDGAEDLVDALAIIHVGSGHDERQRDATAVYQQMAFASFFFPDRSGSVRPPLAPMGP